MVAKEIKRGREKSYLEAIIYRIRRWECYRKRKKQR